MTAQGAKAAVEINSSSNPTYKTWLKLKNKRGRDREDAFLIESRKLIADYLASTHELTYLVCQKEDHPSLMESLKQALHRFDDPRIEDKLNHIRWTFLSKELFDELTEMESSDGLIGVASGRLSTQLTSSKEASRILLLDNLQDPGNVGTLLRSAEAFGFKTVIGLDSVDFENSKVLRASMGSAFRLTLHSTKLEQLLTWVADKDIPIIGADMGGEDYRVFEWPSSFCLALGNEGNGLRNEMNALIRHSISIPMTGLVESLNVAVSGSVIMSGINKPQVG